MKQPRREDRDGHRLRRARARASPTRPAIDLDPRRRLRRDGRARPRGTTVPVTMDEMVFLTRAVARGAHAAARGRRHAVRLVPGLRRGGRRATPSASSRRAGADAVKLEGAGPMLSRRTRDRRRRDPGDGPHRPDAAVGDDARRLQDARADGRGGDARSSTTRSRSRRPAASRSCSRRCRRRSRREITRRARDPDDRDRRRSRAATARCSSTTTCSACTEGQRAALRQALREARRARSATRSRRTRTEVRSGAFPEEEHTYSMPEEELEPRSKAALGTSRGPALEQPGDEDEHGHERHRETTAAAERASVQPWTASTPSDEQRRRHQSAKPSSISLQEQDAGAVVAAARAEEVAAVEREPHRPEREREHERREREREHVACAAVAAAAAEPARGEVERAAPRAK